MSGLIIPCRPTGLVLESSLANLPLFFSFSSSKEGFLRAVGNTRTLKNCLELFSCESASFWPASDSIISQTFALVKTR